MTVAVTVLKKKRLVIGADTQMNFGDNRMPSNNHNASKIFTINGTYVAGSGWGLYDNIIQDLLSDKKNKDHKLNDERSIFKFFNNLYFTAKEKYSYVNNQCNSTNSPFADLDARFLIANRNGIFYVSANMSVHKFERYYAIGSGCDYALGAIHALYDSDFSAKVICQKAISAAIDMDVRCGGQPDLYEISL
jgi:ATP-dependent protease HslVU (ClpYQ) peptidase subunit